MHRILRQTLDAARSSVSPRRLGTLLLGVLGAGALVLVARGSTPWGAPWAGAAPSPARLEDAPDASRLDRALGRIIDETGVDRAAIRVRFVPIVSEGDSFARAELDVPVPRTTSFARMNTDITRAAGLSGASVLDVIELGSRPGSGRGLEIMLGVGERATHRLTLTPEADDASAPGPKLPRVAVVFDDMGYSMKGLARDLWELDVPLTFGVIAGLEHSAAFAESAEAHGHEVILHVPMEPLDRAEHDPGKNAILADVDPLENLRRLRLHLDGLDAYTGVSNHMGSRVTADPVVMALVMEEMRARSRAMGRELFFLDSRTTPFSVVPREARRAGVRVIVNNLFLDGPRGSEVDPQAQVARLEEIARRRGSAIGIGHVGEDTVESVRVAAKRWRSAGIEMVTLSKLAGTPGDRATPRRPS